MFEDGMKMTINSYKKIFENDTEVVNDIKAYLLINQNMEKH